MSSSCFFLITIPIGAICFPISCKGDSFFFFLKFYMYVCSSTCMSLYHLHTSCLWRAEKGLRTLRTGAAKGHVLP